MKLSPSCAPRIRLKTKRTHEMNTLYDLPEELLRARKELLRLRKYGWEWKLTHKSGKKPGSIEAALSWKLESATGKRWMRSCALWDILQRFGMRNFARNGRTARDKSWWTKRRSEISARSKGHRGGSTRLQRNWSFDADYITKNYATLFTDWKQETKSSARR